VDVSLDEESSSSPCRRDPPLSRARIREDRLPNSPEARAIIVVSRWTTRRCSLCRCRRRLRRGPRPRERPSGTRRRRPSRPRWTFERRRTRYRSHGARRSILRRTRDRRRTRQSRASLLSWGQIDGDDGVSRPRELCSFFPRKIARRERFRLLSRVPCGLSLSLPLPLWLCLRRTQHASPESRVSFGLLSVHREQLFSHAARATRASFSRRVVSSRIVGGSYHTSSCALRAVVEARALPLPSFS